MAEISINLDSLTPKSFKKTVRHKVKEGKNTFRFLPPFGDESNGYPYRKWSVVWGLTDPNSGRMRPYASSSTYEGQCPVFDYLDLLKQEVEKEKATLISSGFTEDQVKEKFNKVNEFISTIRPKTVYAYNVSDKSGTVGVVELKSTAHKDVLKVMNQYIKDYGQDPTSLSSDVKDSGVWINVIREGKGFDTKYSAEKNQVMLKDEDTGVPSYQDDRSPLASNIIESYEDLAYDLNSIYEKKSYEELKEVLVANIIKQSEKEPRLLIPGFGKEEVSQKPSDTGPAEAAETDVEKQPEEKEKTPKKDSPSNDEDLLAIADDLFNS